VIDGGIRQAGSRLRVTVQLTDTITEAQLWVEAYERTFDPDKIFDIQPEKEPFRTQVRLINQGSSAVALVRQP